MWRIGRKERRKDQHDSTVVDERTELQCGSVLLFCSRGGFPRFTPLVEDRGFRDLHAHSVNLYVSEPP